MVRLVAFADASTLSDQVATVRVASTCDCGCASVGLRTEGPHVPAKTVGLLSDTGREDYFAVSTSDGGDVSVVLHVLCGFVGELVPRQVTWQRTGGATNFSARIFHPAAVGRYARKGGAGGLVPVLATPFPGVPVRGRNATFRADSLLGAVGPRSHPAQPAAHLQDHHGGNRHTVEADGTDETNDPQAHPLVTGVAQDCIPTAAAGRLGSRGRGWAGRPAGDSQCGVGSRTAPASIADMQ